MLTRCVFLPAAGRRAGCVFLLRWRGWRRVQYCVLEFRGQIDSAIIRRPSKYASISGAPTDRRRVQQLTFELVLLELRIVQLVQQLVIA